MYKLLIEAKYGIQKNAYEQNGTGQNKLTKLKSNDTLGCTLIGNSIGATLKLVLLNYFSFHWQTMKHPVYSGDERQGIFPPTNLYLPHNPHVAAHLSVIQFLKTLLLVPHAFLMLSQTIVSTQSFTVENKKGTMFTLPHQYKVWLVKGGHSKNRIFFFVITNKKPLLS